jgi:hypothetical protein
LADGLLTTYPIASPISRRRTIAPYAQSGMAEVVCVTVVVLVTVVGGAVAVEV